MNWKGALALSTGLALAGMFAVAGCAAPSGTDASKPVEVAPPPSTASSPAPPASQSGTSARSEPTTKQAGIGDEVAVGTWKITVLGAQPEPEVEDRRAPQGKQFLLVPMDVTNTGTLTGSLNADSFDLVDRAGKHYTETPTRNLQGLDRLGSVPSGVKRMAVAVYEVPLEASSLRLVLQPSAASGQALERAVIALQ